MILHFLFEAILKSYDKKKSLKNDYNDFSPKYEGKLVP
jgi:hypothetical protein